VQQLAGMKGNDAVDMSYFESYLNGDNAAGVFAHVVSIPDAAGKTAPLLMSFGGANGSGLATPDMVITGLSQRLGPLGGDLNRLAADVPKFDPAAFFGQAAPKLFGGIGLLDVLPGIDGPDALDAAPSSRSPTTGRPGSRIPSAPSH
jgi:hypothetical protein